MMDQSCECCIRLGISVSTVKSNSDSQPRQKRSEVGVPLPHYEDLIWVNRRVVVLSDMQQPETFFQCCCGSRMPGTNATEPQSQIKYTKADSGRWRWRWRYSPAVVYTDGQEHYTNLLLVLLPPSIHHGRYGGQLVKQSQLPGG
jgi:hypothetical protein